MEILVFPYCLKKMFQKTLLKIFSDICLKTDLHDKTQVEPFLKHSWAR